MPDSLSSIRVEAVISFPKQKGQTKKQIGKLRKVHIKTGS